MKRTSVRYSITQIDTDKAIGRSTSFSSSSSSSSPIHNEVNEKKERTKMHTNSFVNHFRHYSKRKREKLFSRRLAEDINMLSIDDNGFLLFFLLFFLSSIVWQIILKDDLSFSSAQGRMAADGLKNVSLDLLQTLSSTFD